MKAILVAVASGVIVSMFIRMLCPDPSFNEMWVWFIGFAHGSAFAWYLEVSSAIRHDKERVKPSGNGAK